LGHDFQKHALEKKNIIGVHLETHSGTGKTFQCKLLSVTCYGNYGKYQKPTWEMYMNTPSCGIFHCAALRIFWCTSCRDEITFDLFKMVESNARIANGKHMYYSW